jgi:hypothetical protein
MAASPPVPQDGIESCFFMSKKAQLIVRVSVKGEPMVYECSLCDQVFPLFEHGTPRDAMAQVWTALEDHVRISHHQDLTSSEPE